MALIACPECGKQISTEAKTCPSCGYPLAERRRADPAEADTLLMEVRPSWWRFFWHLLFCWLLIPWFIALYRRSSFVMRIYPDRVSIEEGVWSKETSEFFIRDIRSVDVRQGFWGRLVGVGDVTISTAASVDGAEEARGVPRPHEIRELLIARRQQMPG